MPSQDAENFFQALAAEIQAARKHIGLSQDHLATKSGVDRGSISRFERLERVPSILALYDMAEAVGVPLHRLVETAYKRHKGKK